MQFRSLTTTVLVLAGLGWLTAPLAAQLPSPIIPKGLLRVGVTSEFSSSDRRFFGGVEEPGLADFIRDSAGANLIPALGSADELLARVSGQPDARLNLGRTTASRLVTVGRGGLGFGYGVTDRVTVFGRLPLVRVVVRSAIGLDSTNAGAGFNPADPVFGGGGGAAAATAFFTGFGAALDRLRQEIARGAYDLDPARKALAEQTAAEGTRLRDDLLALTLGEGTASPFLPTRSSVIGGAIQARVAALQAAFATLGVTGFTQDPILADGPLTAEGLRGFLTNPQGPVAGSLEAPTLSTFGNAEVGVAVALAERLSPGEAPTGFRLAGIAMVRLPTGQSDLPEAFFDVGTGADQLEIEVGGLLDLIGGRGGLRVEASHLLRRPGTEMVRITTPDRPVAFAATLATVERDPGGDTSVSATPFLRLAPSFALTGGASYRRRGTDRYRLAADQETAPDPSVLGIGSDGSWLELAAGLSYRSPLGTPGDRGRMPLEASAEIRDVVSASGGRVTRAITIRGMIRLYTRFP